MAETRSDTKGGTRGGGACEERGGDSLDGVAPEVVLKLMRDMLLFRRFEERAEEAYAIGKIGGFCHLHIGQEATAAGHDRRAA